MSALDTLRGTINSSSPQAETTETIASTQLELPPASSQAEDTETTASTQLESSSAASESQTPPITSIASSTGVTATTLTALTSDSTSFVQTPASSGSSTSLLRPTSTESSSPTQLAAGSIAGIAVGSIVALVLIAALLLFVFGFRVRRSTWRGHITKTGHNKEQAAEAAGTIPDGQHGKAELEDDDYSRRVERLHAGGKPELEGSRPRKAGWRGFSIGSVKGKKPKQVPAELAVEPAISGPHELSAGNDAP